MKKNENLFLKLKFMKKVSIYMCVYIIYTIVWIIKVSTFIELIVRWPSRYRRVKWPSPCTYRNVFAKFPSYYHLRRLISFAQHFCYWTRTLNICGYPRPKPTTKNPNKNVWKFLGEAEYTYKFLVSFRYIQWIFFFRKKINWEF